MAADLLGSEPEHDSPTAIGKKPGEYVVVARRYRPKSFAELVGQNTVSQALGSAIQTNRVGHAYLFTGARGVGKTSTARIFAKALNCQRGPTINPCGECDICRGIASGEDVDVLEIDGASNRGIDEIRQLRQNVNVRPSRARFKIYIIDEVHMLTTPAFNALLKTLEEPPEHVKFIFCTTEADKIPITVLSRCQRFDFAPMEMNSIIGRLEHIVKTEGIEAEPEALQIIARRAAGSMRDSQSLLEQLFSFGGDKITVDDVHSMLGTAKGGRLSSMGARLRERNPAAALQELDSAVNEGVDIGQFAEQLLGYFRDMAAATVGCPADMLLHTASSDHADLAAAGSELGLQTILAIVQILDQAVVRMRQSTHVRTLVEMALLRICRLEDLDQLATLAAQLRNTAPSPAARSAATGTLPAANRPTQAVKPPVDPASPPADQSPSAQKKTENSSVEPATTQENAPVEVILDARRAKEVWQQAITTLGDASDMTADLARLAHDIAISAPNTLVATFTSHYSYQKSQCERPDRKARLEQAASAAAGGAVRLEFRLVEVPNKTVEKPSTAAPTLAQKQQLRREKERDPFVRKAMELFEAEVERVVEPAAREEIEPASAVSAEEQ